MSDDIIKFLGLTIFALFWFVCGLKQGEKNMKHEAIKSHNAHWTLNETNGDTTFTWNTK